MEKKKSEWLVKFLTFLITILVKVKIGKKNGLRLMIDQHSNYVSFYSISITFDTIIFLAQMSMGTVAEDHSGFQIFVGDRAEFPVMRERSLLVR